ncbi:MAG: AAA family ATPase [Terriglobales bacterium]
MTATNGISSAAFASPDGERSLLGAILLDNAIYWQARALRPDDFSVASHREVFACMEALAKCKCSINIITLPEKLDEQRKLESIGGRSFLASLTEGVSQRESIEYLVSLVKSKAGIRRAVCEMEQVIEEAAQTADPALIGDKLASIAAALRVQRKPVGVRASEIQVRTVEWLWRGRIALGKITMLDGDPGLGKSAVSLDVEARITTGSPLPDGSPAPSGGIVVLSAEDGAADTICPRLIAASANLERVLIINEVPCIDGVRPPLIPADIHYLESAIGKVGAKLLVIDPLVAFLSPQVNSWRDQDIRTALTPLAAMAERTAVAVLAIRHLSKAPHSNTLYRGGGSIGIIAAARSGLVIAPDPDDSALRVLASTKSNLGPPPRALRYRVESLGNALRVVWKGESAHSAASLFAQAGNEERRELGEATEFLRSLLARGRVPAQEALRGAQHVGISRRTLQRAKSVLGVQTVREGFGRDGHWLWRLPEQPPKEATAGPLASNTDEMASYAEPAAEMMRQLVPPALVANQPALAANSVPRGKQCHVHGENTTWWQRPDGESVCAQCHPDPADRLPLPEPCIKDVPHVA